MPDCQSIAIVLDLHHRPLIPEKARLLDMPVLESPAGIVEPSRQTRRDAGVNHDPFGNHVVKAQRPQSAQIRGPAEMLGEQRRIEQRLHQERQVKADQTANQIDQAVVFSYAFHAVDDKQSKCKSGRCGRQTSIVIATRHPPASVGGFWVSVFLA
jgi:hypothetical protein